MSNTPIYDTVATTNTATTIYNNVQAKLASVPYGQPLTQQPYGTALYSTDAERMLSKIGRNAALTGNGTNPNYKNSLYSRFYVITANPPSSNGPGNSGWRGQIGTPGAYNPVYFGDNDTRITATTSVGILTSGYVYSPTTTTVTFQTLTDDGIRVDFNGSNIINSFIAMAPSTITSASCQLYAGQYHPIKLIYYQGVGSMIFQLSYKIGTGAYTTDGQGVFYHNYNQL